MTFQFSLTRRTLLTLAAILATLTLRRPALAADPGKILVHVNQPGAKIDPLFYGLMTEEINYSYDGGLYAELIRNRTFRDDAATPAHWSATSAGGTIAL